MSHFVTFVLVPIADHDVFNDYQDKAGELLAPYDENLEVESYVDCFRDQEWNITTMREHYGVTDEPLEALLPHMQDWCGREGVIQDGKLCQISNYNPQSKWDWWTVAGRYSGWLVEGKNILPVSEIPQNWKTPFAIVDKEGGWHQRAEMGWWGTTSDEQEPREWQAECSEILSGHQDCMIVVCDLHI